VQPGFDTPRPTRADPDRPTRADRPNSRWHLNRTRHRRDSLTPTAHTRGLHKPDYRALDHGVPLAPQAFAATPCTRRRRGRSRCRDRHPGRSAGTDAPASHRSNLSTRCLRQSDRTTGTTAVPVPGSPAGSAAHRLPSGTHRDRLRQRAGLTTNVEAVALAESYTASPRRSLAIPPLACATSGNPTVLQSHEPGVTSGCDHGAVSTAALGLPSSEAAAAVAWLQWPGCGADASGPRQLPSRSPTSSAR
jgi:hypothetical protein